jgi:tetratricopeptide (TPR) repeat protein
VHSKIDGQSLWLDGTGNGARIEDIFDTPSWRQVLPVRSDGAQLLPITMRANARPTISLMINADESASTDLPTVLDVKAVVRNGLASAFTMAKSQLGEKELNQAIGQFFIGFIGDAQFSGTGLQIDNASGLVSVFARAVTTTTWFSDGRKRKRALSRLLGDMEFSPDRGRAIWSKIPVAAADPDGMQYHLTLRLPNNGTGFTFEGAPDFKGSLGGYEISRSVKIDAGIVIVDERRDSLGTEIPAEQIATERDLVATAKTRLPVLIAPKDHRRKWNILGVDPEGATQVRAIEDIFANAIIAAPDEATGYSNRAAFRNGIGDRRGAVADYAKALSLEPSVKLYLRKAGVLFELGDLKAAISEVQLARNIDASSEAAIVALANLHAANENLAAGLALLNDRIEISGDVKGSFREAKASLLGEFGDPIEALKLLDTLLAEKPGSTSIMNAQCWIKGIRYVSLDTAFKDCNGAIEGSEDPAQMLDSRAMLWFRLNKFDDALRDLDSALAASPGLAAVRFMRGVVLMRLQRKAEADAELAIARRLAPSLDKKYARYGIKP